jgi:hypothetical protein
MDFVISTRRRIAGAKNAIEIAKKTSAKMSILKKSAKRRKSAARKRRNAVNPNVKIVAVMIITLAAGVKSSMSRTVSILRTKEGLSPSLIR